MLNVSLFILENDKPDVYMFIKIGMKIIRKIHKLKQTKWRGKKRKRNFINKHTQKE